MSVKSSLTRKTVVTMVMSAIAILLGVTRWGFIPWFAGATLTLMHVPVVIGAVLEGPVVGLVIGLLLGLSGLIQGTIAPTSVIDTWFADPLVSVLPRLFIGPFAWLAYRLLAKRSPRLAPIISGIVGSLTNSVLVLTMTSLRGYIPRSMVGTSIVTSGIPAAVVAALVLSVFDRATHPAQDDPTP
jgi:uncharacterized membrane protein